MSECEAVARESVQVLRTSDPFPSFIADSMHFVIEGKRPFVGRLSVFIWSLSRNCARFALRGGASVGMACLGSLEIQKIIWSAGFTVIT